MLLPLDEALEGQQKAAVEKIVQTIESNNLQYYKQTADELLADHDASSIVAAVLKLLTKEPDTTPVKLTEEKPLPSKRDRKYDDRNKRGYDSNKGKRAPMRSSRQGHSNNNNKRSNNSYKSKSNSYNKNFKYITLIVVYFF